MISNLLILPFGLLLIALFAFAYVTRSLQFSLKKLIWVIGVPAVVYVTFLILTNLMAGNSNPHDLGFALVAAFLNFIFQILLISVPFDLLKALGIPVGTVPPPFAQAHVTSLGWVLILFIDAIFLYLGVSAVTGLWKKFEA